MLLCKEMWVRGVESKNILVSLQGNQHPWKQLWPLAQLLYCERLEITQIYNDFVGTPSTDPHRTGRMCRLDVLPSAQRDAELCLEKLSELPCSSSGPALCQHTCSAKVSWGSGGEGPWIRFPLSVGALVCSSGALVVPSFWIGCTTVSIVSVWVSSSSAHIICSGGPCQLTFSLFADKNYQQGMSCDWNWDAELLYRLSVRHGCFVYKCLSSLGLTLLLFK